MKLKTTKKAVKDNYYRILSLGYCEAQALLNYEKPFAYSAGVYGWACDYYDIDGVCISTGYIPLANKNMKDDYAMIKKCNELAMESDRETRGKLLRDLIGALSIN